MTLKEETILALDVGDVRIGLAMAGLPAAIARPYGVIANDDNVWQQLRGLIGQEAISAMVVGLPRDMNGNDTTQTKKARAFAAKVQEEFNLPVHLQDEALTSQKAEAELKMTKRGRYNKETVDALAATYILEDFLNSVRNGS